MIYFDDAILRGADGCTITLLHRMERAKRLVRALDLNFRLNRQL